MKEEKQKLTINDLINIKIGNEETQEEWDALFTIIKLMNIPIDTCLTKSGLYKTKYTINIKFPKHSITISYNNYYHYLSAILNFIDHQGVLKIERTKLIYSTSIYTYKKVLQQCRKWFSFKNPINMSWEEMREFIKDQEYIG